MYKDNILFIGFDTHKTFTEVAHIEDMYGAKPVHHGKIKTTKAAITKLARQYQSKYPQATLHFVYEAGPCGYWIYRLLTSLGHCCYVVAPSLIPKKPGDKVKTDKRLLNGRVNQCVIHFERKLIIGNKKVKENHLTPSSEH